MTVPAMRNILEMEDEETESLVREVNGGSTKKKRGGIGNGAPTTPPSTSSHGPSSSFSSGGGRRATTALLALSAVVALLIILMRGEGTTTAIENGSLPEDVIVKNASASSNEDLSSSSTSAAAATDDAKSTTSTKTTSKTTTPHNPLDLHEGFVYSKRAKVVPDPYQKSVAETTTTKKWSFWDGDEAMRPDYDYTADYPNGDIPGDKFPDDAWQTDAVYVNHILDAAANYVAQAKEAIFTEYGHGKPLPTEMLKERMSMFHWDKVDLTDPNAQPPLSYAKRGTRGNGGYTTQKSWDGLVLRLLHACMTNRPFVVVMGGHSAAAGHGNHFHQSYMMQMHKVLAPVLARLGVPLMTRNMAQGGLGTLHNALGMGSIYGNDMDVLLWDSGMTERDGAHIDLFMRQAILSGEKVPVLWGGTFAIMQDLSNNVDAEVGEVGLGRDGIPEVVSPAQAATIPHAARFMKCAAEQQELCQAEPKYCAVCWIDRDDVPVSSFVGPLLDKPGGQVSWHPGWRDHQLRGRVLAFTILEALQEAIQVWSEGTMGGPPLDDDWWHVSEHYKNIKAKASAYTGGDCKSIEDFMPARVCTTGMQARTQYTPRHDPEHTSISSIIVPDADGRVPVNEAKEVYTGPDVDNRCFELPADAVDVLAIVSHRRHRQLQWSDDKDDVVVAASQRNASMPRFINTHLKPRHLKEGIVPGKGWSIFNEPAGRCDGEYYSICGRQATNTCPMLGHHDSRGLVVGNEYSGWLVMEIPNLSHGMIILKLATGIGPESSTRTAGWTSVNNEGPALENRPEAKKAGEHLADTLPDQFEFEYAIDGVITTLSRAEFLNRHKQPQRVMEVITLLDDPAYPKKDNVQVAFRMKLCGRACTFGLSHIYWA